jgi:hypothetical protein
MDTLLALAPYAVLLLPERCRLHALAVLAVTVSGNLLGEHS